MSHLSLVVNNSNKPVSYSQIKKVFNYGFENFEYVYFIACLDSYGEEVNFTFRTESEMWRALDQIRYFINSYNESIKNIKLIVSNPLTWLDLAKQRVAKGISATKKHRANEHRQAMRTLDR